MNKELIEQCEQEISKALMQLMRKSNNAFIVNILLNLEKEYCSKIEALELNGTRIKINPEFYLNQSKEDKQYSLLRAAWHIPFFDQLRGQYKEDKDIWNAATNHYNNLMLKADKSNSVPVPDWATCDDRFRDVEKDDIYQRLLEEKQNQPEDPNPQSQKGNNGNSGSKHGDGMSNDLGNDDSSDGTDNEGQSSGNQPMTQEQIDKLKSQLENLVQQAAMQTKMAGGSVPPSVNDFLDDLYNPKLKWESLLLKYMNSFSSDDYSYAKVNKSLFPHGIIMPTLFSEGLGRIAIANDESCSVSDEEFKTYLGAIQDIKTRLNPEQIDVVAFTTQITKTWSITTEEDISKIKFRGNGGTHIPVVFDHFNRPENRPQVLIIFSDMYSDLPRKQPPYDVIWISVNNTDFKAPFGRTVFVKV